MHKKCGELIIQNEMCPIEERLSFLSAKILLSCFWRWSSQKEEKTREREREREREKVKRKSHATKPMRIHIAVKKCKEEETSLVSRRKILHQPPATISFDAPGSARVYVPRASIFVLSR